MIDSKIYLYQYEKDSQSALIWLLKQIPIKSHKNPIINNFKYDVKLQESAKENEIKLKIWFFVPCVVRAERK